MKMRLRNAAIIALFVIQLVLSTLMISISNVSAVAEQQWVEYGANPVLTPTANSWDSDYVLQPRVLYDGAEFRMWYVGSQSGMVGIGYAVSSDGFKWSKQSNPVLTPGQGAWDSYEVGLGSVLWDGTRFLMWYTGRGSRFDVGAFGFATSDDGITWTKYSSNPVLRPTAVDQRYMGTPFVVKTSALYNMWYAARGTNDPPTSQVQRILYATSFDGIHWSKYTGVPDVAVQPSPLPTGWDSGSVFSPSVYYDGSLYGMWYSAFNQTYLASRIGFATSKDAAAWTKLSGNPVLSPGPKGSWDESGVENPSIVLGKGQFMLYYDGTSETVTGSIGLATPPSGFIIPEFKETTVSLVIVVLFLATISVVSLKKKT